MRMVPSGVMSVTSPIAFGRPAGGGERTKPTTLCVMVAPVGLAREIDCSCAYTASCRLELSASVVVAPIVATGVGVVGLGSVREMNEPSGEM